MSDVSQPDSGADDSRLPLRLHWQTAQKFLRNAAAFVGEHRREVAAVVVLLMMMSSVFQPEEGQTTENLQESQQVRQITLMLEEFSSEDFPVFDHPAALGPTAPTLHSATDSPTPNTNAETPIIPINPIIPITTITTITPQTDPVPETPDLSAAVDFAAARPDSRLPQAAQTQSDNPLPEAAGLSQGSPGIRLGGRIEPMRR